MGGLARAKHWVTLERNWIRWTPRVTKDTLARLDTLALLDDSRDRHGWHAGDGVVQIIRANRRDRVPCRAVCRRLAFRPLHNVEVNWTRTFQPEIDDQPVPTPCLTDLHLVPLSLGWLIRPRGRSRGPPPSTYARSKRLPCKEENRRPILPTDWRGVGLDEYKRSENFPYGG